MKQVGDHTEVTPTEARGGGKGTHLFVMLAISTVAACLIMGAIWSLSAVQ